MNLARFMFIYCIQLFFSLLFFPFNAVIVGHTRFLNFYGEANSRLERNFSVYGDPLYRRTLLIKAFSLVLFSAPDIHLKTLQNMWVDSIMYKFVWQQSMKRMSEGWAEFVLAVSDGLHVPRPYTIIKSILGNGDAERQSRIFDNPECRCQYKSISISCPDFQLFVCNSQHWKHCLRSALDAPQSNGKPSGRDGESFSPSSPFLFTNAHKAGISCSPPSSTTRSGNTRDLVQSSLCSPDVGVCSPSIHSKFIVTYIHHYHSVLFYSSSHSFSCAFKIPAQSLEFSLVQFLPLSPFLLAGASGLPGYTKWGSHQSLPLPMGKKTRWLSTLIVGVFWAQRAKIQPSPFDKLTSVSGHGRAYGAD